MLLLKASALQMRTDRDRLNRFQTERHTSLLDMAEMRRRKTLLNKPK